GDVYKRQAMPAGPPPAPRELYSQAYADYARGNYDLAMQGFGEYIRNYPGTDFTDNAQYWIGECLYGKKQYAEAIEAWNGLLRDYPSSDKLPDARVKKGMALERLGRRSQALIEYRYVVDRFPNSPAARIAREHLNP
ncbi:MAG: tol-pal system protein YbgF, partial [Candidatus Eisenbacteria bacterium]|nr:tol-pal system protein YbgF [Candidatus Eisenbacteria bacterium]